MNRLIAAALAIALALLQACSADTPPIANSHISSATDLVGQRFDDEPADCSKLVPGPATFADPTTLASGWPERDIELAVVVDESFVDRWGEQWLATAQGIVNRLQDFYITEVNLEVVPVQIALLNGFDASEIEGTDPVTVDNAVINHYREQYGAVQRDTVLALLGSDVAGSVAGKANCIGGAGFPDVAYVWSEALNDEPSNFVLVDVFAELSAKVAIHEVGHMLGAHHHYTNCTESLASYSPTDALAVCGVMINDIGLAGLSLSRLNRLAVRGWADAADL